MNFLKMHTSLWIFILTWICNSSSDRPGCPPFDPDLRCIQFIQQCNSDDDCKEDELCCYQPACGTSCTKKAPEDKCPPYQEDVICKRFINNCEFNSDCPKGQICCTVECGRDCRPPKPDICSLPKKTGQCEAFIPRYYYDTMTKSCEKFIYGGCEGNANNFETFEECKQKCDCNSNVCSLPKETGPCEALIPRYYYDTMTQSCEKFFYGGCQGNANNFQTLEACNEICANNGNVCELPMEIGPCDAAITRYFYNTNTKSCQTFIYGGCEGNANNFETLEDCRHKCDDSSYEV